MVKKIKKTNTGAVKVDDTPDTGLPTEGLVTQPEHDAPVEPITSSEIEFVAEKRAVLDHFGADRMELGLSDNPEHTDMDLPVALYDAEGKLIDVGAETLRGVYEVMLKESQESPSESTQQQPTEAPDAPVETVEVKRSVVQDPVNG